MADVKGLGTRHSQSTTLRSFCAEQSTKHCSALTHSAEYIFSSSGMQLCCYTTCVRPADAQPPVSRTSLWVCTKGPLGDALQGTIKRRYKHQNKLKEWCSHLDVAAGGVQNTVARRFPKGQVVGTKGALSCVQLAYAKHSQRYQLAVSTHFVVIHER